MILYNIAIRSWQDRLLDFGIDQPLCVQEYSTATACSAATRRGGAAGAFLQFKWEPVRLIKVEAYNVQKKKRSVCFLVSFFCFLLCGSLLFKQTTVQTNYCSNDYCSNNYCSDPVSSYSMYTDFYFGTLLWNSPLELFFGMRTASSTPDPVENVELMKLRSRLLTVQWKTPKCNGEPGRWQSITAYIYTYTYIHIYIYICVYVYICANILII